MNLKEFRTFVKYYDQWERRVLREQFNAADEDRSGTVTTKELGPLIEQLGDIPVMEEVLKDVLLQVDEDGTGKSRWAKATSSRRRKRMRTKRRRRGSLTAANWPGDEGQLQVAGKGPVVL